MASDVSFVEYVCEQISESGKISFKKMFGEYALYYDDKVIALVCDNQLFLKPTNSGRLMIGDVVEEPPYPGAKPYFLIGDQLDNKQWLSHLIEITASEIPAPKPKKAKLKKAKV